MGTLTKKLHVLKSGGTEETCNIYTTPEEVGGSPYLALEVDGQKGYVKLGSTTDANATHLRVKKNDTTYAAWKQAEATVPTGSLHLNGDNNTFTCPMGVRVLKIEIRGYNDDDTCCVGVTPGKTYTKLYGTEESWDEGDNMHAYVTRGDYPNHAIWATFGVEGSEPMGASSIDFTIYWSPEINKKKPTYTDY